MRVYEDAWRRAELPRSGVVTIGNFDGLHRGQQELIDRARERAAALATDSLVLTFEPHPLKVLAPERAPRRLTTPEQKHRLIEAHGVDGLVIVEFTPDFGRTSAATFVEDLLVRRMAVAEVLVGTRFTFGHGRSGTLEYLSERGLELGFAAHGVSEVTYDGAAISSTRIRAAVEAGDVESAREMLGRPFSVEGIVAGGEMRGRELGWPTANLAAANELFPGDGVYATEVRIDGEPSGRPSVTNVGTRPTFGEGSARQVESHLLDFDADLYGRQLEIRFCRKLRGERRFGSSDELVAQIELDVRATREYFAAYAC